jgi:hypothetical protein
MVCGLPTTRPAQAAPPTPQRDPASSITRLAAIGA